MNSLFSADVCVCGNEKHKNHLHPCFLNGHVNMNRLHILAVCVSVKGTKNTLSLSILASCSISFPFLYISARSIGRNWKETTLHIRRLTFVVVIVYWCEHLPPNACGVQHCGEMKKCGCGEKTTRVNSGMSNVNVRLGVRHAEGEHYGELAGS